MNCQYDRCLSAECKIRSGQIRSSFLDAFNKIKREVSFPLEDKHVVNEHHALRKSHDATQKMSSSGARDWLKTNSWRQKRRSKSGKKFVGVAAVYREE